jgi:hypothetical protein
MTNGFVASKKLLIGRGWKWPEKRVERACLVAAGKSGGNNAQYYGIRKLSMQVVFLR